jgi:hypothetical protein
MQFIELLMTLPAILFGIVLSTAYGTAFHFWKGGNLKKLLLYILLAWVGFWSGHFAGAALGWTFAAVGPINTGLATLGAAAFLFIGEWLSRVEVVRKA